MTKFIGSGLHAVEQMLDEPRPVATHLETH